MMTILYLLSGHHMMTIFWSAYDDHIIVIKWSLYDDNKLGFIKNDCEITINFVQRIRK